MKALGITRRVDDLGRVTIPVELRRVMDIDEGTPIEIFTAEGQIILRKYEPACIFCGSAVGVEEHKGKRVCKACRVEIGEGA